MSDKKLKAYAKPSIKNNERDPEGLPTVLAVGIASAALGGLASAVSRAVGIRPESKGELFLQPIEA